MSIPETGASTASGSSSATIDFRAALRIWSYIGWMSFGGPAGQIALMHRELVEKRRWISESRFLHALNYCMLIPGPEAQQLAVYIGWLMHRARGGIAAGVLFVLPGIIVMGVLSWIYVRFGQVPIVSALFFGLKAAVLAVVIEAVLRIGRRAIKTRFHILIAITAFVAIFALHVPFPWIVAGAAITGLIVNVVAPRWLPRTAEASDATDQAYVIDWMLASGRALHVRPSAPRALRVLLVCLVLWLAPTVLAAWWLGGDHVIAREGHFFSQAAVVTFGGAYAVLAYVAQRAVDGFGWLQPGEMVDGLALAETTPGPLIMVLQFVGFVAAHRFPGGLNPWLAACLGAAITTWVTFVPSFCFILVGAPYVEAMRKRPELRAALSTITAAIVGVVLNLTVWFALHTLFARANPWSWGPISLDVPEWGTLEPGALVLAVLALWTTLRWKLGMGWTLPGCAVIGALYWTIRHGI